MRPNSGSLFKSFLLNKFHEYLSIFTATKNNLDRFDLLGPIMGGYFKVILKFEGFPYNAVVIFGLEPDFLFKSILTLQLYSICDFCFQVPEDPFFFCNDCFRQFNYSPKNEKVGNFKAYPFIDVNAL